VLQVLQALQVLQVVQVLQALQVAQVAQHKPPVLQPQDQQVIPKVDDAEVHAVPVLVVLVLPAHQARVAAKPLRAIHLQQHPLRLLLVLLRPGREPLEAKRVPLQARVKGVLNDVLVVAAVDSVAAVPPRREPTESSLQWMAKSTRKSFASSPIPICQS